MNHDNNLVQHQHLLAHDCSGSTLNNDKYFSIVNFLYYGSKIPFTDILIWSSDTMKLDSEKYEILLQNKKGTGGTNPHLIIQWMIDNHFSGDVILITDGQIPLSSVDKLEQILSKAQDKIQITFIKCILIQTTKKIDTTVIAPFIRRFPNEVILYGKDDSPFQINTGSQTETELIETIQSIHTIEELQSKADIIFSNTITKMIGKQLNISIRDEILKLQKRLMLSLRKPPKEFDMQAYLEAFSRNDEVEMKKLSIQLNDLYLSLHKNMTWPSLIFHLLRMTSGSLKDVYSVHALGTAFQAERIRRADVIEHFEATQTQTTDSDADFICPITYEEESDVVLLIKKPKNPLLSSLDKKQANEVLTCPISALNYPSFVHLLINHIDHPISLSAMKGAQDSGHPIDKSPLTRSPIIGGICLGAAEDHSRATNWTIASLMTGGKNVGNMDQWFALFWYLIEKNQIPYLTPILPKVRQHMIYRLKNHYGTASLTSIPFVCQTALPVGICCWFSLNIDYKRFCNYHSPSIPVFIKMAQLAGFKIDDEVIREVLILSTEKRCRNFDSSILPSLIKISYATSKLYPNLLLDGPVSESDRENELKKLPITFSDIPIDIMRIVVNHLVGGKAEQNIPFVNWAYGLERCKMPIINICPATLRPYLLVPPNFIPWTKSAEKSFCKESQLINCHKQYITYVNKFNEFPSKQDFANFCMKMIVPKKNVTLPAQIEQFVDTVIDGYNIVIQNENITPSNFITITNKSNYIRNRIQIEHDYYCNFKKIFISFDKYDYFIRRQQPRTHK